MAGTEAGPIRVLVVTDSFPNPTETFIVHQVNGLIARGCAVDILATRATDDAPVHSIVRRYDLMDHVIWRRRWREGILRLARDGVRRLGVLAAWRAVNPLRFGRAGRTGRLLSVALAMADRPQRGYDAILAHFGPNGDLAQCARELGWLSGPLVVFFHGNDIGDRSPGRLRRRYRRVFERAELVCAASEAFRRQLAGAGIDPARLTTQRMGIETGFLADCLVARPAGAVLRAITVGRLVEKKGIDTAIAALTRLRDVAWEYHVVGEGVLRDALAAQAERLGVGARVRFHGSLGQDAIRDLMRTAHLLIASSRTAANGDTEACPLSIQEGMAAGLPVCATRHGGIPEMVQDGVNGLMSDEGDIDGLAANLARLASDVGLRHRLGAAARQTATQEWDVEAWNDRMLIHIQRLCGRSGGV